MGRTGNDVVRRNRDARAGPGEVRIRNHAAGLNFFDILQVQGKYQIKPPFPFTPGAEVAGVVDAVGADVSRVHGRRSRAFDHARRRDGGIFAGPDRT